MYLTFFLTEQFLIFIKTTCNDKHFPRLSVNLAAMRKHLCCILLSIFLCTGLISIFHEETPGFRTAGNTTETLMAHTVSDCSFTTLTDDSCPVTHHSLFNDENSGHRISDALCPGNFYTHNHASSKLLKLKLHLPTGQSRHLHVNGLPAGQNSSLLFTPNAIRYSRGYYIFALAHILI